MHPSFLRLLGERLNGVCMLLHYRVRVSDDQSFFATCSNDGTVKMWECSRLDGRSATNRSRYTYNKQGGQIKTITFCDLAQSIAAASDSGAIHVFRSAV